MSPYHIYCIIKKYQSALYFKNRIDSLYNYRHWHNRVYVQTCSNNIMSHQITYCAMSLGKMSLIK